MTSAAHGDELHQAAGVRSNARSEFVRPTLESHQQPPDHRAPLCGSTDRVYAIPQSLDERTDPRRCVRLQLPCYERTAPLGLPYLSIYRAFRCCTCDKRVRIPSPVLQNE